MTSCDKTLLSLRLRYIDLIRDATSGVLHDELGACVHGPQGCNAKIAIPFDAKKRHAGSDWPVVGQTMVGTIRLDFIIKELVRMIQGGVPGDFVEMGIWRGGAILTARAVMVALGDADKRHVFGFDAFDSITKYSGKGLQEYLTVSQAQVEHNFRKYDLWDPKFVHLVPGMFEATVPKFASHIKNMSGTPQVPGSIIAFLRIDGNFYTSYESSLYYLYERVPVGGIVYFDDIPSHKPCYDAWKDFNRDQKLNVTLSFAEEGDGAWFRKMTKVTVDFRFYRSHGRID
jgi:hypothetical protein